MSWLGRNGINGSGGGFPARVGLNQVNAFWNGSFTNFGHSSDNQRQATPQDVVAHEYGHAIFQTTPGGAGSGNENGGLNEATGDIFGALTEHFANNPNDPPDYLVGEEVNLSGGGPIRNMFNPSALGDPNCWSTAIPNTEVHAAAGPLNHWFYLVARGSNPAGGPASPTCNGSTVTGIDDPAGWADLLQRDVGQDLDLAVCQRAVGLAERGGQPLRRQLGPVRHRQGGLERRVRPRPSRRTHLRWWRRRDDGVHRQLRDVDRVDDQPERHRHRDDRRVAARQPGRDELGYHAAAQHDRVRQSTTW